MWLPQKQSPRETWGGDAADCSHGICWDKQLVQDWVSESSCNSAPTELHPSLVFHLEECSCLGPQLPEEWFRQISAPPLRPAVSVPLPSPTLVAKQIPVCFLFPYKPPLCSISFHFTRCHHPIPSIPSACGWAGGTAGTADPGEWKESTVLLPSPLSCRLPLPQWAPSPLGWGICVHYSHEREEPAAVLLLGFASPPDKGTPWHFFFWLTQINLKKKK